MAAKPISCLIVGAGPQGLAAAVHLRKRHSSFSNVQILDPDPEPLACWCRRADAVGMTMMRSPAAHHIDVDQMSLASYAAASGRPLKSVNQRPLRKLFEDHTFWVLSQVKITHISHTGKARSLGRSEQGWRVETDRGSLLARMVVLALGTADCGRWPDWARALKRRGVSIGHVLESACSDWTSGSLAIIGGGLTAAEAALSAAHRGQQVTLFVKRHFRIEEFDTHPSWFRDDALANYYWSIQPPQLRLEALARARNPGTITQVTARRLEESIGEGPGQIRLVTDPIERVAPRGSGATLITAEARLEVDHVMLATGFDGRMLGAGWIQRDARKLGLPLAPSGHPVPNPSLEWAAGLYLCGALAELQLGPTARGIAGGRQAAQLITHHACSR